MNQYTGSQYESSEITSGRNTVFENLTKAEKIWGIIAILLFIGSFNDGPPGFIPFLILVIIFYSVTERDKTKSRVMTILNTKPVTTVVYLAKQIDKSEDHVTKVLKIMILDEGAPIRFDLTNKTVEKVGKFPHEQLFRSNQNLHGSSSSNPSGSNLQVEEEQDVPQNFSIVPEHSRSDLKVDTDCPDKVELEGKDKYCIHCNSILPAIARYCQDCGVKQ